MDNQLNTRTGLSRSISVAGLTGTLFNVVRYNKHRLSLVFQWSLMKKT